MKHCVAFEGSACVASGPLSEVASKVKAVIDRGSTKPILIFDDQTSEPIEVDFRGNEKDVLSRLDDDAEPRGPGRPKLGVVAREITLLPRHWEWLSTQSGGASVALRKLVEEARRTNAGKDSARQAREVTYKFISTMAGNEPHFEEATRALFAGNAQQFEELIAGWPVDVRDHVKKLAAASFT